MRQCTCSDKYKQTNSFPSTCSTDNLKSKSKSEWKESKTYASPGIIWLEIARKKKELHNIKDKRLVHQYSIHISLMGKLRHWTFIYKLDCGFQSMAWFTRDPAATGFPREFVVQFQFCNAYSPHIHCCLLRVEVKNSLWPWFTNVLRHLINIKMNGS